MFGWFRRRLILEHTKLLFLNKRAAEDMDLRVRLRFQGYHEEADRLEELEEYTNRMDHNGVPEKGLTSTHVDIGLKINRELMGLYELGYNDPARNMDARYRPIGGWKFYLERTRHQQ